MMWEFCSSKTASKESGRTEEVTFKLRPKSEQVANQLMGRESIPKEDHMQQPGGKREHVSFRELKV